MKRELQKIQLQLMELREEAIPLHGSGDTWKRDDNVCFHLQDCVRALHNALTCLEQKQTPLTECDSGVKKQIQLLLSLKKNLE